MSSTQGSGKISIPYYDTVDTYNFKINISPPRYPDFDLRDFEENMRTVRLSMPPFRISFYQLALVWTGSGMVAADGQSRTIDEYTLFFNLPGQILYWEVPRNWQGYYVCIQESFYTVHAEGYPSLYHLPYFKNFTPAIRLRQEEAVEIIDVFERINKEYLHPGPYNKSIIKSYLATLLTYCVRYFDRYTKEGIENRHTNTIGERFKEQVHIHVSELKVGLTRESLSAGSLAEALAISPQHLSDSVRKELGQTPTEYMNAQLMNESGKLLRTTNLQVKEIAYQFGFSDASYFSRLFRKVKGVTPAAYRKG